MTRSHVRAAKEKDRNRPGGALRRWWHALAALLHSLHRGAIGRGASEWWRMPLIGLVVSAPISLTTSLFLATYGAEGPYGGFWRLLFAGLAASVPIFASSGFLFAPIEIWLTGRPRRLPGRYAGLARSVPLALAGVVGAFIGYAIVVWALPAPPPKPLLPVLLVTYPLNAAIVGIAYTLYDEYVKQLEVSAQLAQEMRVARHIQQGLFPKETPRIPGYCLVASCQPAHETGGDFYDFVALGDGRVGIIIADVAGKGMPAALLMANVRSTWRAEARAGAGPGETLCRVNQALSHDMNGGRFVTVLYAVLDPRAHRICFAGAGHPLPLVWEQGELEEVEVYGLPLGLQRDGTYPEVARRLAPGGTVLLYTDGIVESMNGSRELFGFERLKRLVQQMGDAGAQIVMERTRTVALDFGRSVGQLDDLTVVVLKREPFSPSFPKS
jgi:serine phosphatase RsbU (regulator of sigma subunit)